MTSLNIDFRIQYRYIFVRLFNHGHFFTFACSWRQYRPRSALFYANPALRVSHLPRRQIEHAVVLLPKWHIRDHLVMPDCRCAGLHRKALLGYFRRSLFLHWCNGRLLILWSDQISQPLPTSLDLLKIFQLIQMQVWYWFAMLSKVIGPQREDL